MKKQTEKLSKAALMPDALANKEVVANCDQIAKLICHVQGVQVMLDRDLAKLYGITTGNLNKAVKRNLDRFPSDFMVRLSAADVKGLIFQNGTSKNGRGGSRHLPYAFTEQGVAMLSSVLKSKTAIEMNIAIMRAFVQMRKVFLAHQDILAKVDALQKSHILDQFKNEERFSTIFDALGRVRLLPSGIIPAGTEYDSQRQVSRLVESAKSEIVIIDPYADATILDVLSGKGAGVTVRLVCKNRGKPTTSEIAKFNKQYKGLTVSYSDDFHDRFVIIDNAELHNFGSSVNSLGRRVSTYSTRDAKEIKKLLSLLP